MPEPVKLFHRAIGPEITAAGTTIRLSTAPTTAAADLTGNFDETLV